MGHIMKTKMMQNRVQNRAMREREREREAGGRDCVSVSIRAIMTL
jgi:hypothetical protein